MSRRDRPSQEVSAVQQPRAERLAIPEHALAALEHQARRHYRRWWLDQAEHIARLVIRFDLGRAAPWFILGDIEMRRMNWERAFGHFQQAVDCHRADAMAWCRGAEALFHARQYARAKEWFEQALAIGSPGGSPGAHRARGFLERHERVFAQAGAPAPAQLAPDEMPTQKMPALTDASPEAVRAQHKVLSLHDYRQK